MSDNRKQSLSETLKKKKLASQQSSKSEARKVALLKTRQAFSELSSAIAVIRADDPEAAILLKRAMSQVQTSLDYLH